MTTKVKWAAELKHVREVSLLGSADLCFWQDRLVTEDLHPAGRDNRIPIMIVTAEGKFMGLRFRELSISIVLTDAAETPTSTIYWLARAFNSNCLFAFCERVLFSTPYEHANVCIKNSLPAAVSVTKCSRTVFHAEMTADATWDGRTPSREGEDTWEARIMFPHEAKSNDSGKLFFARIRGETRRYPFLAGEDTIAIQPQSESDIFQALLESRFAPQEWIIRTNATHAKSKTYTRSESSDLVFDTRVGE